eukprot:762701-Hanusia_phi.AAC.5
MKATGYSRRSSLPGIAANRADVGFPENEPTKAREIRRPSLLQVASENEPSPCVQLEKKVEEAARRSKYGCPSRLKQLLCLAKSVRNIRSQKCIQTADHKSSGYSIANILTIST